METDATETSSRCGDYLSGVAIVSKNISHLSERPRFVVSCRQWWGDFKIDPWRMEGRGAKVLL